MRVSFPFEEQETGIFGKIRRPVADVNFWSKSLNDWVPVRMIVDSGADYTLLPLWLCTKLGIDVKRDCRKFRTAGVGGEQLVYVLDKRWKISLGKWENEVVLGFLNNDSVPPLLGRLQCLEKIQVCFKEFKTTFEF